MMGGGGGEAENRSGGKSEEPSPIWWGRIIGDEVMCNLSKEEEDGGRASWG